jgi:hypothetical protein
MGGKVCSAVHVAINALEHLSKTLEFARAYVCYVHLSNSSKLCFLRSLLQRSAPHSQLAIPFLRAIGMAFSFQSWEDVRGDLLRTQSDSQRRR